MGENMNWKNKLSKLKPGDRIKFIKPCTNCYNSCRQTQPGKTGIVSKTQFAERKDAIPIEFDDNQGWCSVNKGCMVLI